MIRLHAVLHFGHALNMHRPTRVRVFVHRPTHAVV